MKTTYILLLIVGWVVCGVLTYGITLADFQHSFPTIAKKGYRGHCGFAAMFGLLGPVGLLISLFLSGFAEHGLKWKE